MCPHESHAVRERGRERNPLLRLGPLGMGESIHEYLRVGPSLDDAAICGSPRLCRFGNNCAVVLSACGRQQQQGALPGEGLGVLGDTW